MGKSKSSKIIVPTDEAVRDFQQRYYEEYLEEISFEDAKKKGTIVLTLFANIRN